MTFLELDLVVFQLLFDLLFDMFAGISISFLQQPNEGIESTVDFFQIIVGEFASPATDFAPHLFPLAFEYIFIHAASFCLFENALSRFKTQCCWRVSMKLADLCGSNACDNSS